MALLGDGVLIAGGTTSTSDLDEVMVFASVLLPISGTIAAGGTTSMSDLDEVMVFAVIELAASEKVESNSYPKPIESVVTSDDFTKTGA